MGRSKKTRAERLAEQFGEHYRMGKAKVGMTNQEIAHVVGLQSQAALKRRRENPGEFTLGELLAMGAAFRWTEEEYLSVIRAGMR